jgi:hypothetical protein
MESLMLKNIVMGVLCVALLGMSFVAFQQWNERKKVVATSNTKLQEFNAELGRAQTRIGDAAKYIDELEGLVKSEVEKYNGQVSLYGALTAKYEKLVKSKEKIIEVVETVEVPVGAPVDPFRIYLSQEDGSLLRLPLEWPLRYQDDRLTLRLTILSGDPASLKQRVEYKLSILLKGRLWEVTTPDDQRVYYFKFEEVDRAGNSLGELDIYEFEIVRQDERTKEFRLAPHVDIGGAPGVQDGKFSAAVSLGVSGWGYGVSENDLSWRFVRLGVNATRDSMGASLTPVLYNVGGPLPLFSNLWVGPQVGYDFWNGLGFSLFVGSVL